MRALLDINVLIALFDQEHIFNSRAHQWLEKHAGQGIATCPITENGFVRILSHPRYSQSHQLTPTEVIRRLSNFLEYHDHAFWPGDLSLCDTKLFDQDKIIGNKQITDIYLLGLAVKHKGQLVSFDKNIQTNTVRAYKKAHLQVL